MFYNVTRAEKTWFKKKSYFPACFENCTQYDALDKMYDSDSVLC